jgi:hypothetical protein
VSEWPTPGARVVVWAERTPSRAPREAVVDHVTGRTFTVAGLEAVFNRSTGRSKPVRRSPGAFGTDMYVAVEADSERARQVLGAADRSERTEEATRAVNTWLADRSESNRRAAIEALQGLDDV